MLSLLALIALVPPVAPGHVYAAPGGTATLRVEFPAGGVWYNRQAPARVRLTSPWGQVSARPSGPLLASDPQSYYAGLNPLWLKIAVPGNVRPGTYPLTLNAELYLCSKRAGQCYRKTLSASAELRVGETGPAQGIRITDADLRP